MKKVLYTLLAISCITATLLQAVSSPEKVLLKCEDSTYLAVKGNKAVSVENKADASIFTVEQAAAPEGFVGSSHRTFSYGGKYLYYDLTLRMQKPTALDEQWLAPVHYLYYNHYHSGPVDNQTRLIAEEVKALPAK